MSSTKPMLAWTMMTIPERLVGIVDSITSGVRVATRPDGKIVAQSFALLHDAAPEQELKTDVYVLVPEADIAPTDAHRDGVRAISGRAQRDREISAAVARSHMKPDQRSPGDMIAMAQDLLQEARLQEKQWMIERDRKLEEKRLDDEAIAAYRVWERGRALVEKGQ